MKLGVSLVTLNRPEILKATFGALTAHGVAVNVIVDNGSDAPATAVINEYRRAHPECVVIANGSNVGLSRAVNQGIAELYRLGCDVLVHLDDDALVSGNAIQLLAAALEKAPELGLAIPNGQNYIEYIPGNGYRELRWGLGFVWALRRATYEQIGAYDPQLLHQQECDLAIRVRMAGSTVGAVEASRVHHNDPGVERSEVSKAREHLGCVQFRDKFCEYFRGKGWTYGTMPLFLMQHWPPDQEWYRRYAEHHNIDLNPQPAGLSERSTMPGATLGLQPNDYATIPRTLKLPGGTYNTYIELRSDNSHWCRGDGYDVDRQKAIDRWKELTGEVYQGYQWPNLLRPSDG